LKKILKIVLPLLFGIGLLAYFLSGFTAEQYQEVYRSIRQANLWLIFLSVILGILSHIIRAFRWEYLLEDFAPKKPHKWNLIFSVGLSYLVNLGIPRSGEVARAVTLAKYEKLPFAKVMGTILAERVIDLLVLGVFVILGLSLEFPTIYGLLNSHFPQFTKGHFFLLAVTGFLLFLLFLWYLKVSQGNFARKLKRFLSDIHQGLFSIFRSRHKWAFLWQTFLIWFLYLLMLYVVMLAFDATKELPLRAVLLAFIAGSLSIVLSNGGIGTYPVFVTETLSLYGIAKTDGFAFSITMWTAQTLILILFGLLSMVMLPLINKEKPQQAAGSKKNNG